MIKVNLEEKTLDQCNYWAEVDKCSFVRTCSYPKQFLQLLLDMNAAITDCKDCGERALERNKKAHETDE
jgi:hypothetical protein